MSKREDIAQNIYTTLRDYDNYDAPAKFKRVVRQPVRVEDLSRQSLPLVFIESSNEEREDIAMGGASITREGTVEFVMHIWVQSDATDTTRNACIEVLEEALDADRTRGGNALDTQITLIELIETGEAGPYASIAVTVRCNYCYKRSIT